MKHALAALVALYVVCSPDKGLTRTFFENAHDIAYVQQCLIFKADRVDGISGACDPEDECVVREGTVPPPGTPSDDYQKQESNKNEPAAN